MNLIESHTKDILNLCKSHKVKELYAFGSVVNGNFTEKSDIDLLIEIDEPDPLNRGSLLLSIWDKFEDYFDRKVDLLTFNAL